jgi:hypothetical protein
MPFLELFLELFPLFGVVLFSLGAIAPSTGKSSEDVLYS